MIPASPIRSVSPNVRPKIVFNYPPSPIRERPSLTNQPAINIKNTQRKPLQFAQNRVNKISSSFFCTKCQRQYHLSKVSQNNQVCLMCIKTINSKLQAKNQNNITPFQNSKQNIVSKKQNLSFTKQNKKKTFSTIPKRPQTKNIKDIVNDSKKQQQQLTALLKQLNNQQFASNGVKTLYKQKKIALKNHYEKIKQAIKKSIQKDLQQLEKRQQKSLQCIQNIKTELKYDIQELKTISNIQGQKDVETQQYQKVIQGSLLKKKLAQQLIEQLTIKNNESSKSQNDSLKMKLTQEQISQRRQQLYDLYHYTVLDNRYKNGSTLFSFQGKHIQN